MPDLFQERSGNRLRRSGTVYLITLGAALLVSLLAMASLLLIQVQREQLDDTNEMSAARRNALSGLKMAVLRSRTDSSWRDDFVNDRWDTEQAIGDGTYRFRIDDPDGSLLTSTYEDVAVIATGMSSHAKQLLRTTMSVRLEPLDCLGTALLCGGHLSLDRAELICDAVVCSNTYIAASDSDVHANVEAVGSVWGSRYHSNVSTGVAPRTLPQSGSMAIEYYTSIGTSIDINALPLVGSQRQISGRLISHLHNPWGQANPDGVYVIDCAGNSLVIRNSRLAATLIIVNASQLAIPRSSFMGAIQIELSVSLSGREC